MSALAEILGRSRETIDRNYQAAGNKGYVIDGVFCRGITRLLHDTFYSNFRPMGRRRGRIGHSSVEDGEAFHRQVYHTYKCRAVCTCKARFGVKTLKPRKNSPLEERMKLFKAYLREKQWQVYDCEMIVGCQKERLATSIDLVCVDNIEAPTSVIIVELKTGYTIQKNTPRTIDTTGKMTGIAGQCIKNTFVNQHQLQLWFCCEAFERAHGIFPHAAAVVYVNDKRRVHTEFAATWWFRNEGMRRMLFAQLVGQTCSLFEQGSN